MVVKQHPRSADDNYVFRASPLRNIELTAPYFHPGYQILPVSTDATPKPKAMIY